MGRMAKNRKVKESAETVWLNMVSTGASLQNDLSALLSGKWQKKKGLRGSSMKKDHGNNEQRQGGPLVSMC